MNYEMLTKYSKNLDKNNILKEYPRPQLKRDSYLNLNGIWECDINDTGNINCDFNSKILVPFCIESQLSNIRKDLNNNEYIIYKKEFSLDNAFIKDITILNFEAVDQVCEVYLNGKFVGKNIGGYLPFNFDISHFINIGNNVLILKVKDELNMDYPYGKQRKKRGGMWYTAVSGIWGSVWLESVSKNYIRNIKLTSDIDNEMIKIEIDSDSDEFNIEIREDNKVIYKEIIKKKIIDIKLENCRLWSPETPFLYNLIVYSKDDKIESYFAMRKFSVNDKIFLLNNKPYFVNGVLDQGYYSDGIYTPSSYEAYRDDVLKMKELGFNTLRKHIKIESKLFYYYCDLYGMLVFQDMVNNGKYSFLKDTVFPTIGIKKKLGKVSDVQKDNFMEHTKAIVSYLYNVPSIVCYTIFNEGWGQFEADKLYDIVKSLDSSRVVDTTSGWFKENKSDVDSLHVYFRPIKLKNSSKPLFVSEFGGYSYKIENHSFNKNKTYGYRKYKDNIKFEEDFINLYKNEILGNLKNNLAGAIYTQVSDVEDETNGLLTYDREICKVNELKVKKVMEDIYKEFNKIH